MEQGRNDITTEVNNELPTNNSRLITAKKLRDVLQVFNTSKFNLVDDYIDKIKVNATTYLDDYLNTLNFGEETMGKITIQSVSNTSWPGSTITNNSLGYNNFTIVSDILSNNFNTRTLILNPNLVAEKITFDSTTSSTLDFGGGEGIYSISILPNNNISVVLTTNLDVHTTEVYIRAKKLFN